MTGDVASLEPLLEYLYRNRGFDFHGYKRSSLLRRIQKRMQLVGAADFEAYLDMLEVDPEEFSQLFNTILINVTSFFRDGDVWQSLCAHFEERVLPRRRPDQPVRVWSAGCASGEEAYTTAIVLAERMGGEAFCKVAKIYATDVDDEALNQARLATYSARDVEAVPPALLEKYFERVGPKYVVNKDLRRCVIFGRHNLIQDAPISRVDALLCRNTLMYFNAETQAKILSRFHFALRDEGVLFLGKAEMLLTHGNLFAPIDLKRRIFAKVPRGALRERAVAAAPPPGDEASAPAPTPPRLHEAAFEAATTAQLVLDPGGALVLANERARALFGLAARDLGRPFRELEIADRGELRPGVERALVKRHASTVRGLEWAVGGSTLAFDASAAPLVDAAGTPVGAQVCFVEVSEQRRLQQELQQATRELEATYEELQSTSEELETTNEELQSTVEELETTNEELQSTNEELETMNEELQSTNEELQTMNEELRQRGEELNQVNTFLNSILASLRVGVVVLDHDMLVRAWNQRAEDLWGLRQDEVQGKHFLSLDIGLPVERLTGGIRACIAGEDDYKEAVVDATNRRGKMIACKVACNPLSPLDGTARGAVLLMEEIAPSGGPTP
ncbi:MAG TPA: CheR family methyltransferase [Polyangiaceae bacterium]|nr:CheR family methyltransferase [Polyangiaceae bacterium]